MSRLIVRIVYTGAKRACAARLLCQLRQIFVAIIIIIFFFEVVCCVCTRARLLIYLLRFASDEYFIRADNNRPFNRHVP